MSTDTQFQVTSGPNIIKQVVDESDCIVTCKAASACRAANIATTPGSDGKFECQLVELTSSGSLMNAPGWSLIRRFIFSSHVFLVNDMYSVY